MSWGEKPKVYTSRERYYDELLQKYPNYFPEKAKLFEICAAIGIRDNKKINLTEKQELINTYSIDREGILREIMEILYPELTPEQRLEELEKYAEYGINKLHEEVIKYGPEIILEYFR